MVGSWLNELLMRLRKIFIIIISTVCLKGLGTISIHVERLQISACLNTQLKVKERFKLLLLIKVMNINDKLQNILETKTSNFSGLHSAIRPAKLTNHSVRSS